MSESNREYTFKTAALKAVTLDGHLANFNRTDTKKLSVNGVDIKDLINTEGGFDFKRDWKKLVWQFDLDDGGLYKILDDNGKLLYSNVECGLKDATELYARQDIPYFMQEYNNGNYEHNLEKLEIADRMFIDSSIVGFNSDMPNLISAKYMFMGCQKLIRFNSNMPKLINATGMFSYSYDSYDDYFNHQMETFDSNVDSLQIGTRMFEGFRALGSFKSKLPSLTDGSLMFYGCSLNKESVISIINTIKNDNTCAQNATLDLGVDYNLTSQNGYIEDNDILSLFDQKVYDGTYKMKGHGGGTWTVTLRNGSEW